jgi:hypothetical protein
MYLYITTFNTILQHQQIKRGQENSLFDATRIIRHTKIKSYSNLYDKDWEAYLKKKPKSKLKKSKKSVK